MATQAGAKARWAPERRFYTGMAAAMIVLVLIGFGPSFYFRGYIAFPRPNPTITPPVLLHGIAFSLWMLLFAAQAGLVGWAGATSTCAWGWPQWRSRCCWCRSCI